MELRAEARGEVGVGHAPPGGSASIKPTSPGHADSVAVSLDGERWPGVVGTIAGDDTILVIAPDNATAEAVQEKLLGMLERG